jgi:hypothetical protein
METNKKILGKINTQRCPVTLRTNVNKHQYGNTLKIDFAHTLIVYYILFCRVLYPNYRGIVYLSKYDFVFEKYLF